MKILLSFLLPILMLCNTVSAGFVAKKKVSTDTSPIQQALTQLNQYANIQKQLNVQNPDLAYSMRKALVIADLLFDSQAKLNISLCSEAKSAFIRVKPKEYEVHMGKFLDQLDSSWQPFFDTVQAPKDSNSVSCSAIRALFSLGANQPITDRHAKVAVLAAILSPFNQGPVGDCFAVNDLIRDHDEYFRHNAEDCASIVMKGYIERPVNGAADYFFFLPILADDDRNQPFVLSTDGTFPATNSSIFDAPGFVAAQVLMGGDSITSLRADVLQSLSSTAQKGQIKITPSQLIKAIAQAIANKTPQTDVDTLCNLGEYAFSSLTNNPIMRGVESAIAAMAEDRATDSTRGNINSCVAGALKSTWEQLKKMSGVTQFEQTFTSAFNSSYRLLYNLNIPLAQVSADGSSTDGGFQLYERDPSDPTIPGERLATPQQFRQLILDAVNATVAELGSTSRVKMIANRVTNVIQSNDFLKNVLWDYDQANRKETDPIQNYLSLSRTPMQSCDGDNPYEVDDIDTEITYDNDAKSFTPHNAKDLIFWCLNLAEKAPAEMIPMDSPQHAFNFMPTNPDLVNYIKSKATPGQWVQKTIIIPGTQVAKRQIDANTQQALTKGMYDVISSALPDEKSYQQLEERLSILPLSVHEYSQKLLDGINALLKSDENQAYQVALVLDGLLLQSLPEKDQAVLEQSAIRFAFTNWNEGTNDIYFCAFFNPRTQKVGFGTIFENKTNLQPMDENAWVNNQQWDVDLSPHAPTSLATGT